MKLRIILREFIAMLSLFASAVCGILAFLLDSIPLLTAMTFLFFIAFLLSMRSDRERTRIEVMRSAQNERSKQKSAGRGGNPNRRGQKLSTRNVTQKGKNSNGKDNSYNNSHDHRAAG